MISTETTFWGYRPADGRVGLRNYVIVLPVDDLSKAAAEAVAYNIQGVMALPHPYGRLQFGADLDLHFRTLIGTGCNPNVAAVVVIGIEDGWHQEVVEGSAKSVKPVVGFGISDRRSPRCAAVLFLSRVPGDSQRTKSRGPPQRADPDHLSSRRCDQRIARTQSAQPVGGFCFAREACRRQCGPYAKDGVRGVSLRHGRHAARGAQRARIPARSWRQHLHPGIRTA